MARVITEDLPNKLEDCHGLTIRVEVRNGEIWLRISANLDRNGKKGAGPEFTVEVPATSDFNAALTSLYTNFRGKV